MPKSPKSRVATLPERHFCTLKRRGSCPLPPSHPPFLAGWLCGSSRVALSHSGDCCFHPCQAVFQPGKNQLQTTFVFSTVISSAFLSVCTMPLGISFHHRFTLVAHLSMYTNNNRHNNNKRELLTDIPNKHRTKNTGAGRGTEKEKLERIKKRGGKNRLKRHMYSISIAVVAGLGCRQSGVLPRTVGSGGGLAGGWCSLAGAPRERANQGRGEDP